MRAKLEMQIFYRELKMSQEIYRMHEEKFLDHEEFPNEAKNRYYSGGIKNLALMDGGLKH